MSGNRDEPMRAGMIPTVFISSAGCFLIKTVRARAPPRACKSSGKEYTASAPSKTVYQRRTLNIYDITVKLAPDIPVWPGDPTPRFVQAMSIVDGAKANVTHAHLCVHTGTHVDAPRHFFDEGLGVDELRLEDLIGPAWVCHLTGVSAIDADELKRASIPEGTERLLLRTRNSRLWHQHRTEFEPEFVALTSSAARWIVSRGIRLVGVDYLSVQRFSDKKPTTHRVLLEAEVVILEGLNLWSIDEGWFELICLPLKIDGCDGAPTRAVLLKRDEGKD